jgi:hypothetical protein
MIASRIASMVLADAVVAPRIALTFHSTTLNLHLYNDQQLKNNDSKTFDPNLTHHTQIWSSSTLTRTPIDLFLFGLNLVAVSHKNRCRLRKGKTSAYDQGRYNHKG